MPGPERFELVLGFVAAATTTSAWVPQAVKTLRTRSARDFSWSSLGMLFAGLGLWLAYGLVKHDLAIIAANAVTLALVGAIAAVKRRYG